MEPRAESSSSTHVLTQQLLVHFATRVSPVMPLAVPALPAHRGCSSALSKPQHPLQGVCYNARWTKVSFTKIPSVLQLTSPSHLRPAGSKCRP